MRLIDFPYPKVNRPKGTKENERISKSFDSLDRYIEDIRGFVFTDIVLIYGENDDLVNLSRIQHLMSSILLRSLYLRNGIVDSINARNIISLFANLKSFIESAASLAYLNSLLSIDLKSRDLLEKLNRMAMGNRGESELRVGNIEAVNVKTMFDKFSDFIKGEKMEAFYDVACNAAHPAYDAYDTIGVFNTNDGTWRCLLPIEIKEKIVADFEWYAPTLNISLLLVVCLAQTITKHPKINNFKELTNNLYFNE